MGKHKKFLKSEKAKVKLKDVKLKGPQNVTKTDFKVRKIIIPEQLKNVQQVQSGERKKHNINDCLTRLKNSTSAEAISNLKEIILYQPEDFQKHLEAIIKTVANLSLAIEKNDRKESFKLLDIICSRTSEFNLKPFFPVLVTYLKCAMTHIKAAIQEDSLLMLDLLLKHAPQLVASEKESILSPFLDMISKLRIENNSERTLSLQLGNKITSMKWRKSVLDRLLFFLKCINNQEKKDHDVVDRESINDIQVKEKDEFIRNPYAFSRQNQFSLTTFGNDSNSFKGSNNSNDDSILKYIHMIMPLMFETWMEVKPTDDKINSSSINSHEDAMILNLIMDIILEIYSMIENNDSYTQQFYKKYQDNFDKQFISKYPFTQNEKSKKTQESGGEKCMYQNLSITIMYFFLTKKNQQKFWKYREKFFSFIEECIIGWRMKDPEFTSLMKKVIRTLFSSDIKKLYVAESKSVFTELIKKCNLDQSTYDPKLALVLEIIENNEDQKQSSLYDNLLVQMVEVLSKKEFVPAHLIKTISTLAKRGNQILYKALEEHAVKIVSNLRSSLKVSGSLLTTDHWKIEVANLVYWINNHEVLQSLHGQVGDDKFSITIKEIIDMKLNSAY